MLLDVKRTPLIEDERFKTTTLNFSYNDIEVLMEALAFAKSVYANSAKQKKKLLNNLELQYNEFRIETSHHAMK